MARNFAGEDGFYWFFGTVEDVNDPDMHGRIKVRCFKYHESNKSILPTDSLMWARVLQPITSAATYPDPSLVHGANTMNGGIGRSPTGIVNGSLVFGFFLDGLECQLPLVMGTYASQSNGQNDLPKLALGINSIEDNTVGPEPKSAYAAQYPFNEVFVSQAGITVEYDSTPDHERIRTYHPSGSYTEVNQDGRVVNKCIDNSYDITVKDKYLYVKGQLNVDILGDANVIFEKDVVCDVKGNLTATIEKSANIETQGDLNLMAGGNMTITAEKNLVITSGGNIDYQTGLTFTITAGKNIFFEAGDTIAASAPNDEL